VDFSIVREATEIATGKKFAIKVISKNVASRNFRYIISEVDNMRNVKGHQHIVEIHEVFEDAKNVYLVMELLSGGELLEHLSQYSFFFRR